MYCNVEHKETYCHFYRCNATVKNKGTKRERENWKNGEWKKGKSKQKVCIPDCIHIRDSFRLTFIFSRVDLGHIKLNEYPFFFAPLSLTALLSPWLQNRWTLLVSDCLPIFFFLSFRSILYIVSGLSLFVFFRHFFVWKCKSAVYSLEWFWSVSVLSHRGWIGRSGKMIKMTITHTHIIQSRCVCIIFSTSSWVSFSIIETLC